MLNLLWLILAFPTAGFLILALAGSRIPRRTVPFIGAGAIGLSLLVTLLITGSFFTSPPSGYAYTQVLWRWMDVGGFHLPITLYLDPLSLVMTLVVTCVGFLIHVYSAEDMDEDKGLSRFFAYMNLFVASMEILLLSGNLVLLLLGWEGVGLCSYLLIGFWYQDPSNGYAGRKAFIVTRVGDTSLLIGLFLLFRHLGTLDIQTLMQRAAHLWPVNSPLAVAAGLLLLGGAVGKSAQLPLQTWLPDAMAGPTPTSALIHAATMVTAGVYLIARMHVIYSLAPTAQLAVAIVGTATLTLAGFSALTQPGIKRALAYSTVSQIGYMFLALGVGAWSAAIFHFVSHAFFKALLFLGAGIVIKALHHERNMFKMGGLRKELPVAFWTFLIAGCALAGVPLVTNGFYSKGLIVWQAMASSGGRWDFWFIGVFGVFLTSAYTFRMIFLTFFGEAKSHVHKRPGPVMGIPCIVLAVFSVVSGFLNTPEWLGHIHIFTDFLHHALPVPIETHAASISELASESWLTLALVLGFALAYYCYMYRPGVTAELTRPAPGNALHGLWKSDWGMDWLYDRLFVWPVMWFARVDARDAVDWIYTGIGRLCEVFYCGLRETESGRVRWYAAAIAIGTVIFIAVVLFV